MTSVRKLGAALLVASVLTACGPATSRAIEVRATVKAAPTAIVYEHPAGGVADRTVRNLAAADAFLAGLHKQAESRALSSWFEGLRREELNARPRPRIDIGGAMSGVDWPCVAIAETGNNQHMTGSEYSSMYGVLNEAVRENSSPEVAARILAGTATVAEQTDMAQSIVNRYGLQGWARSTYLKCRR